MFLRKLPWFTGNSCESVFFYQRSCWPMRLRGKRQRRTCSLLLSQWERASRLLHVCRPSPNQRMSRTSGVLRCKPSQLGSSKKCHLFLTSINHTYVYNHSYCHLVLFQNLPLCLLPRVFDIADQEVHIWSWLGTQKTRYQPATFTGLYCMTVVRCTTLNVQQMASSNFILPTLLTYVVTASEKFMYSR